MRTVAELISNFWDAYVFGVLARDFKGWTDFEPMADDWRTWIVDELGQCGRHLVADGEGYVVRATNAETFRSGRTVPVGEPIARIGFLTHEELVALYADPEFPVEVQHEHPWYRLREYRGYVSLIPIEHTSELFHCGQNLDERCWGRIYYPYAAGFLDPLVRQTHPLTELLREERGFDPVNASDRNYTLLPIWESFDAKRFFPPIVDEINAILPRLGIGSKAFATNGDFGLPDAWNNLQLPDAADIVDLHGRSIAHPEKLLALASIDLWHQRLSCFHDAVEWDRSKPERKP